VSGDAPAAVPFDAIVSVDELRRGGIVSARALVPQIAASGATAVKVIACRPEQYSTRPVKVTQAVPAADEAAAACIAGAPGLTAGQVTAMRSVLGPAALIVAPYDIASCLDAADAGVTVWQVDEAMNANVPLIETLARVATRVYFCTWGCSAREIDTARTILHATELVLIHRLRSRPESALMRDAAALAQLAGLGHRIGWIDTRPARPQATLALALGGSVAELTAVSSAVDASEAAARVAARVAALRHLAGPGRAAMLGCTPDELDLVDDMRPGLVAACAIPAGTVLTADLVACRAPRAGLGAGQLAAVIGRTVAYDLKPNDALTFGVLR